jgi:hypothetical protein
VVARSEIGDTGSHGFDDARRLVPEDAGRRHREAAFDHGEVAVADPGSRRLQEDFARAGIVDLDRITAAFMLRLLACAGFENRAGTDVYG